MPADYDSTSDLLQRFHDREPHALEQLLAEHLPWLRRHVRRRVGAELRCKEDSEDVVQDAVLRFLNYAPRFMVSSTAELRALLSRIAENVLRDNHNYFHAARRNMSIEKPIPDSAVVDLSRAPDGRPRTPSAIVSAEEQAALIRLALEFLDPPDRDVIVLREWQEMEYATIGEHFKITGEAARKRYTRACVKLADKVVFLRKGDLDQALGGLDIGAEDAG